MERGRMRYLQGIQKAQHTPGNLEDNTYAQAVYPYVHSHKRHERPQSLTSD